MYISQLGGDVEVVHEMEGRIRVRSRRFLDPALDFGYLEALVLAVPGVEKVRGNPQAASLSIRYNGDPDSRQAVLDTLEAIPEAAYLPGEAPRESLDLFGVASLGALALLTPMLPRKLGGPLSWAVATPTLLQGVSALISRGVKMEVLDATAVGANLAGRDYFASNSIVALLALGNYLNQLSDQKSTDLLKTLLQPQKDEVWVEKDGAEVRLSADQLKIGSIVVCGSGEMVPVDGAVVEGEASVNQSSITGESVPVHVEPGSDVLSGSHIEEGRIKIRASEVGRSTTMARMSRFLENALRSKTDSQTKTEELADKLVPVTFGLGFGIYALTRDLRKASAVLSVDYGCALKLSNPVTVKSSMYRATQSGVLLKGQQALESLAGIDTLVFDKTGTLTTGKLAVTDVVPMCGGTEEELLALAAGAEEHYSHPLAAAVLREAHSRKVAMPEVSRVDFIVAHGVSAFINEERLLVGSRHFIEEDEGIDCSQGDVAADRLRSEGKSLLHVARNGTFEGLIALKDEVRPEAPAVLQKLKEGGIGKMIVLTGDHRVTARNLLRELGEIDEIRWELKPEEKAQIVADLKRQGMKIAYLGDGVNDAPALMTADVGICMPQGADLAREAAQVVLLKEDLSGLITAREVSVNAESTLKRCVQATFALNTMILLLAGSGMLPSILSALAHNMTTVSIIGYAGLKSLQASHEKTVAEEIAN